MSLSNLRSIIHTKLLTLVWPSNPIACVYRYHKLWVEGYPAITFEPSSSESNILTTTENKRIYGFDIVIMQEMSSRSRDDALTSLISCSDIVMDMFDDDYTLWGACYFSQSSPVEFGEIIADDGAIMYARIALKCETLHLLR